LYQIGKRIRREGKSTDNVELKIRNANKELEKIEHARGEIRQSVSLAVKAEGRRVTRMFCLQLLSLPHEKYGYLNMERRNLRRALKSDLTKIHKLRIKLMARLEKWDAKTWDTDISSGEEWMKEKWSEFETLEYTPSSSSSSSPSSPSSSEEEEGAGSVSIEASLSTEEMKEKIDDIDEEGDDDDDGTEDGDDNKVSDKEGVTVLLW